ncbi:MAG: 4Fe-4S binding protein [Ignavibacteriaceae bacterium]|nr:4Fe-4S binding protein [Ignavibacteriaceae bacterium]
MRELVVISGKGGTGKTSVAASFAVLADRPVIADCDVDAADLHLVLTPRIRERHELRSGREARILQEACTRCGACADHCRFDAIVADAHAGDASPRGGSTPSAPGPARVALRVDPFSCEGCGVCYEVCPAGAVELSERVCGQWMISDTRCGPMVHARLGVGGENSGKLVSIVRREARRVAEDTGRTQIIVDGPPGLGCPVIASIGGASQVLVVTEPTVAGAHDLERVLSLARHFAVPTTVCVNRWDLNPEMTERIEAEALRAGVRAAGRIRYDRAVTLAQIQEKAVAELETPAAADLRRIWENLEG